VKNKGQSKIWGGVLLKVHIKKQREVKIGGGFVEGADFKKIGGNKK